MLGNVTRKSGISFNVSHANIIIVSHSFVLHDTIAKEGAPFRY